MVVTAGSPSINSHTFFLASSTYTVTAHGYRQRGTISNNDADVDGGLETGCAEPWQTSIVADNPRIEELRRRVQKDPASIAFAQLAEEYRRAGSYEDAIAACRAGPRDPSRLSFRSRDARARAARDERSRRGAGRAGIRAQKRAGKPGGHPRRCRDSPSPRAAQRGARVLQSGAGVWRGTTPTSNRPSTRFRARSRRVVDEGLSFEQASAEFLAALEDLPGGLEAALAPPEDESTAPDAPNADALAPSHLTPRRTR